MKHVTQMRIDFLHDGNYDEEKLLEFLRLLLFKHGMSMLGSDFEGMDDSYKEHLTRDTVSFETYPDYYDFADYGIKIENDNYDNEMIVFDVPRDWAVKWIRTECDMSLEKFMGEYTWDDTLAMRYMADADGVLMNLRAVPR